MSTTEETTVAEKHVLSFSDGDVEVVIHTDGEVDVNITSHVGNLSSFSADTWRDVVSFVERAIEMTDEPT